MFAYDRYLKLVSPLTSRFLRNSLRISDDLFAYDQFLKIVSLFYDITYIEFCRIGDTILKRGEITNVLDGFIQKRDKYCQSYGDTNLNHLNITNTGCKHSDWRSIKFSDSKYFRNILLSKCFCNSYELSENWKNRHIELFYIDSMSE